jgi:hypothetical protein
MKIMKKETFSSVHSSPASSTAERRRLARIVHDDRGNASVEWVDAPAGYERPSLSIEGESYRRSAGSRSRDLRKLSEWIKMMRALEERKQNELSGDE